MNLINLSQSFLKKVKYDEDPSSVIDSLANIDFEYVIQFLDSDAKKLTFWINIYNATTQYSLKKNAKQFENRGKFYKTKLITIAGIKFSLDEIEHGILRKNVYKLSLGYLRKLYTPKKLKSLMVQQVDPRIHFALNCGAKSCPPVLFFETEKINEQLDLSSESYLMSECVLKGGILEVPILFSWFRADFGGKKGIYDFLKKYKIIKGDEKPKLVYKDYDWTLSLEKYASY